MSNMSTSNVVDKIVTLCRDRSSPNLFLCSSTGSSIHACATIERLSLTAVVCAQSMNVVYTNAVASVWIISIK